MAERPAEEVRPRQVPLELAVCFGVGEVGEGPIQLPRNEPRLRCSSRVRGFAFAERGALHPGQEEGQAVLAPREGTAATGWAGQAAGDAGQRELRGAGGHVLQGRDLQIHEAALPRRVHDLQHERPPVPGLDAEVVVVLPGKGHGHAVPAEEVSGETGGLRGGERRSAFLGHHGRRSYPRWRACGPGGVARGPRVRGERRRAKLRQT